MKAIWKKLNQETPQESDPLEMYFKEEFSQEKQEEKNNLWKVEQTLYKIYPEVNGFNDQSPLYPTRA